VILKKHYFQIIDKKRKTITLKFRNTKWYSIDSFKDMEECALEVEKIIK